VPKSLYHLLTLLEIVPGCCSRNRNGVRYKPPYSLRVLNFQGLPIVYPLSATGSTFVEAPFQPILPFEQTDSTFYAGSKTLQRRSSFVPRCPSSILTFDFFSRANNLFSNFCKLRRDFVDLVFFTPSVAGFKCSFLALRVRSLKSRAASSPDFISLLIVLLTALMPVSKQACIGRIVNVGFYSCAVNSKLPATDNLFLADFLY